jgi:uncharacterized protein YraI
MNGLIKKTALLLTVLAVSTAWAQTGKVTVLHDRVNLRAKPRPEAEVAGQVNSGTILESRGMDGDWVAVTPPDSIGLWVFAEFVKDNKVATDKLNIRSGAGINYPVVGAMVKNDPAIVRNKLGEWVEIAPPAGATLWVSKEFVAPVIEAASPLPAVLVVSNPPVVGPKPVLSMPVETNLPPLESPVAVATSSVPEQVSPLPPDIEERGLVPLAGQGEAMEFEGILHKTSLLDFGRVSNYCLVDRQRGRPVTVCYIRGNNAQLKEFEGRRLKIKGDGYWVKGGAKAVIVPKQIMPLAGL